MTTFTEAAAQLPADAEWSCCFGYPGKGGFAEYYRTPDGRRFVITNGAYDAMRPFDWRCEPVAA